MSTDVTPPPTHRRIGTVATIVSAVNILLFAVLGLGMSAVNVDHVIVRVPAWYFVQFAVVELALVLVTWPQANRVIPPRLRRAPGFSLDSRMLTIFAMLGAVTIYRLVPLYDPLSTAFGAYAAAGWICLAVAGLAYVRGQFDPPVTTLLSPLLTRVPDPSRSARSLSAVSLVAFLAMLAFCVAIIPLEQLVSFARFGVGDPVGGDRLPIPLAPAIFWAQPVILAVVFVASFRVSNRWIPTGIFAGIRSVTPLRISLFAVLCLFVQLPVLLIVQPLSGTEFADYGGVIILFLIFAVGVVGGRWIGDAAPTKRGKRPRGAAPLVYVGKLPQVAIAPVAGWAALPNKYPFDGYSNATAWVAGMLPRLSAEIGTGTDEQKHAFSRALVSLINTRLKRGMSQLFVKLEEWEAPFLVAGLAADFGQPWQGMPVHGLDAQVGEDDRSAKNDGAGAAAPLTSFTTTTGLEGRRRAASGRVDYWVAVDGGWAHLSCEDEPVRIIASLPELDALASAIFLSDRVVGRRKKPVS